MLRPETKARARALQLLYAWELQGEPEVGGVATQALRLCPRGAAQILDRAEAIAGAVAGAVEALDRETARAAENWRLSRIGVVERNILRVGVWELQKGAVPPKVAIDEAVRLAHWFGGGKTAPFVNGILDRVAHNLGRL